MKKRATITVTVAAGNAINRKEMIQEGGLKSKKTSDHKLLFALSIYSSPRHHAIMLHGSAMFG